MKILRGMVLLVGIVGCLLAIPVMFPRVTTEIPALKPIVHKVRSLIRPESTGKAATPVVALTTTLGTNLTPAQAKFIDAHRRRHELLSEVLRQQ
jgi:hypothetical protein